MVWTFLRNISQMVTTLVLILLLAFQWSPPVLEISSFWYAFMKITGAESGVDSSRKFEIRLLIHFYIIRVPILQLELDSGE